MDRIILASASPGRKKLFDEYIRDYDIQVSKIDENSVQIKDPYELVKKLSFLKAQDISIKNPSDIVIGFDTIVLCNSEILGKPKDKEEAKKMLKKLSGLRQSVITGFAIINQHLNIEINDYMETVLILKPLDDAFIDQYVRTHPVIDFAGGYGVQDNDQLIEILSGEIDNVIGAPMRAITNYLRDLGFLKESEFTPILNR